MSIGVNVSRVRAHERALEHLGDVVQLDGRVDNGLRQRLDLGPEGVAVKVAAQDSTALCCDVMFTAVLIALRVRAARARRAKRAQHVIPATAKSKDMFIRRWFHKEMRCWHDRLTQRLHLLREPHHHQRLHRLLPLDMAVHKASMLLHHKMMCCLHNLQGHPLAHHPAHHTRALQ